MTHKMNPEVKALWIDALRSGEYQQTTGALKVVEGDGKVGYCCLGVLMELACKAGVAKERKGDGYPVRAVTFVNADDSSGDWGESSGLPTVVQKWSGVPDCSGKLNESIPDSVLAPEWADDYTTLISLNDRGRFTFAQIADVIEAQF